MKKFKYIYGPVGSWRLGVSLGIDLISTKGKACNFDCLYCQVGKTKKYSLRRKVYVPTEKVIAELKRLPKIRFDYITFSGVGEPTLAKNLGETIRALKRLRKEPVAVLTNAVLITDRQVRKELGLADFVIAKLDASSQDLLRKVNRPGPKIKFKPIFDGLKKFRMQYKGRLGIQIMFIRQNKDQAAQLARLCKEIKPDEVQINTPLRPSSARPLTKDKIFEIKDSFAGFFTVCVYGHGKSRIVTALNPERTQLRRGKIK